ncbi:glutathione S-transferase 1 [Aplysia californica]|uniref:Glutathione S-transferase 1 n=1 Tax=Aplysia californica TaxID=6500 RepID=A0ABM1W4B2_APLCA|nr:glutathione S-transferase 1 [Aplysia californica]XP_005113023.1 glutathione S-transferase 1 [Aplysia californica]XP_035829505.1 glutathione S-transferase 1 [Aplysia californica]
MATSKIRLFYFAYRGRAEVSRIILAHAGKQYDEVTFPHAEWQKYKHQAPLGQCPMLEVNGRRFPQSMAHFTYLAREFGLYGKTNMDGLVIDVVMNTLEDVYKAAAKSWYLEDGPERDKQMEICRQEETPKYLAYLEKLLSDNGSGYFVGKSLSLADIAAFDARSSYLKLFLIFDNRYPLLEKNAQLVLDNKNIQDYIDTRKDYVW